MGRQKTVFICGNCGHQEPKWLGRCPDCGEWNSLIEKSLSGSGKKGKEQSEGNSLPLHAIEPHAGQRVETGMAELDRVLGGGIIKGSSVLVGGEPGIGKSTIMLQLAAGSGVSGKVLYVSGEESPGQLKSRAERIKVQAGDVEILSETRLSAVEKVLERIKPMLVVVDSIQTLISEELGPVPGTVNQIKYCCHELISWCRERGTALFLVAHVTKEGSIAGPKVIEHMVDTVLMFESANTEVRVIRAAKNRHGSVDEIGLFTMTETGLAQISSPSSLFMVQREEEIPPGIAVAPVYEGSRILLVELQALVVPAKGGFSRIYSDRIDAGRVSRIAAVLEKHVGIRFSDQDIYVNVAGGIRLKEVGIELPLAIALYSARTDLPISRGTAMAGELSLAGEVRPIPHVRRRVKACREMGFTRFIGPEGLREEKQEEDGFVRVQGIKQGISAVFQKGRQ